MKHLSKTMAALLLLAPLGMGAYAAEEKAPPPAQSMPGMNMPQGQGNMPGMNMPMGPGKMHGMMGMMGGMTEEQQDQHLRMMQEHMLQMHDLSDKILAASDPAEKEKLKNQQLQLMKAHKQQMMKMMHEGMGPKGPDAQQQHQQHQNMPKPK
jgi:hypothetical protein